MGVREDVCAPDGIVREIGATSIGMTQHVGALRGLIQGRLKLGPWKEVLLEAPQRFFEAYLAVTQPDSMARRQAAAAFA